MTQPSLPFEREFVFVRHPRARRYVIRVADDGTVRVTLPRWGSRREATAFVDQERPWIEKQQRRAERDRNRPKVAPLPPDVERARWGSCSRTGHICLNWRLVQMPDSVRDYVILHELMHLKRMDHSPKFWNLVLQACPDFRDARAWLRAYVR
jgi:predicted metal-dependent hydrolase